MIVIHQIQTLNSTLINNVSHLYRNDLEQHRLRSDKLGRFNLNYRIYQRKFNEVIHDDHEKNVDMIELNLMHYLLMNFIDIEKVCDLIVDCIIFSSLR